MDRIAKSHVDGIVKAFGLKQKSGNSTKTSSKPKTTTSKPKLCNKKYPLLNGILKLGSKGNSVKQLQRALNAANFKCGDVDGIYGPKVEDAVRRFQMVYLPYEVDGVYCPNTRKKLQAVLESKGY